MFYPEDEVAGSIVVCLAKFAPGGGKELHRLQAKRKRLLFPDAITRLLL